MKLTILIALACVLSISVDASPTERSENARRFRRVMLGLVDRISRMYLKPNGRSNAWPPAFCNKLDCPRYKVVDSKEGYEVREYDASEWVTTNVKGVDYSSSVSPMFKQLFNYISGENVGNKKIKMTAPVITRLTPGPGPAYESNFNMSFFVPTGSNPPQPSSNVVSLVTMPKMTVYVRSFGGYPMTYDTWKDEALKLATAINDQSKYRTDIWYTAGYNSPLDIFNRHNEVWFIGK